MWNGEVLKRLRETKGLTAQVLADHLGVSRPYISQLEGGQRRPGDEFILRLAEFFGVSTQTFHRLRVINGVPQSDVPEITPTLQQSTNESTVAAPSGDVSIGSNPKLTFQMLLGLVRGSLCDVRATLLADGDHHFTQVLTGTVHNPFDQESFGTYQLVCTRECMSLRINANAGSIPPQYFFLFSRYKPHVILRDDPGDMSHGQCELIWFTEYSSIHAMVHHCTMWEKQGKKVEVRNRILARYLSQPN